jgi:gliding motility-associated-like protein
MVISFFCTFTIIAYLKLTSKMIAMNKLKFYSILIPAVLIGYGQAVAQCEAEISVSPPNGSQSLTVQFAGEASVPYADFPCDDTQLPAGWSSTPFTAGSPCSLPDGSAPDMSDYLWAAALDINGQRWVETADYNMSEGGSISFEIRYGVTDPSSDCRGPNSVTQGVELQYSINGGSSWDRITYFMPYSTDTLFTEWNHLEYQVPLEARTTATRFRWFQASASGDLTDRWGLNNINISGTADVTSWEWDFGDLTTSDQQNPEHTFPGYGIYNVSLTITTPECTDSETLQLYINSTPTINDLTEVDISSTGTGTGIELTGISDGGIGGQTLNFTATSSNPASLAIEEVDYTSPSTTAIIRVTPDSLACGDATITARVEYTNISTVSYEELFTVHVLDNSLPWITMPEDIVLNSPEGECTSTAVYTVLFGDNCPGSTIEQTEGLPSGSVFPVGRTLNAFTVTDAMGNQISGEFTVTVTENVPPTIICAEDIIAAECNNTITVTPPDANDNCGVRSLTHNSPWGISSTDASGTYPVGITTITWSATDYSGNTATCEQVVEILPNPSQPVAPDIEIHYGEEALLTAAPDPDHFIRWYTVSDLSDIPTENSSINLGYLTPETYYRYATQVSELTGCESLARPVAAVVTKAPLTVTAEDITRVYGDPNPSLLFSYSGFVFGDDNSVLNEEPVIQTDGNQQSDAGTYPIYFTGGYDNNYMFVFVEGTLTILKKDQSITMSDIPDDMRVTETYEIEATATSGLPVQFSASDPSILIIDDNTITVQKEGTVTIIASNQGNNNYNAAPVVSQVIRTLPAFDNSNSLFTPNGDGHNDYWHIPFIEQLGRVDVKVFNRHGMLVFEKRGYDNLWDGTSNGRPLPEGSYYYIIDSSESGIIKGVINIVR